MNDPNRKMIYLDDTLKALRPIMRKSDYFYEIQKAIQDIPSAQPQACDDAISRKDAIDYLTIKANMTGSYGYLGTKEIHDYLSCMSSVQPERKTGVWLEDKDNPESVKTDGYCAYCSACKEWSEYLTAYCGSCGSDMRGTWNETN